MAKTKKTKKVKIPAYQYKIDEVLTYVGGLYKEYQQKQCVVKDRSKPHKHEMYRVEFSDGYNCEIRVEVLKRKEEVV